MACAQEAGSSRVDTGPVWAGLRTDRQTWEMGDGMPPRHLGPVLMLTTASEGVTPRFQVRN